MKDDVRFLQLWDMYSPVLTATQREITDLYFNYDLSLGEIAEIKGVSRQSVLDSVSKTKKILEDLESKLSILSKKKEIIKILGGLEGENAQIGEQIKNVLGED